MKLIQTLRTCLFFAILVSTVGLISHALAQVSPAQKKVSPAPKNSAPICNRTIKVQVVALDQPWMWNRLGASQPGGMIYALARDVVRNSDKPGEKPQSLLKEDGDGELKSIKSELLSLCGKVRLDDKKRARLNCIADILSRIPYRRSRIPSCPDARRPMAIRSPSRSTGR